VGYYWTSYWKLPNSTRSSGSTDYYYDANATVSENENRSTTWRFENDGSVRVSINECAECKEGLNCSKMGTTFWNVNVKKGYWTNKTGFVDRQHELRADKCFPALGESPGSDMCLGNYRFNDSMIQSGNFDSPYTFVDNCTCADGEVYAVDNFLGNNQRTACEGSVSQSRLPNASHRAVSCIFTGCRDGHHGPLCSVCKDGFVQSGNRLCESCAGKTGRHQKNAWVVAAIVLALIMIAALGLAFWKKSYWKNRRDKWTRFWKKRCCDKWTRFGEWLWGRFAQKMRICIGLVQVVNEQTESFEIEWPKELTDWPMSTWSLFRWLKPDLFSMVAFGCTFGDMYFHHRFIWYCLLPLVVFIVPVLIFEVFERKTTTHTPWKIVCNM
jgi:hypothetical protein